MTSHKPSTLVANWIRNTAVHAYLLNLGGGRVTQPQYEYI